MNLPKNNEKKGGVEERPSYNTHTSINSIRGLQQSMSITFTTPTNHESLINTTRCTLHAPLIRHNQPLTEVSAGHKGQAFNQLASLAYKIFFLQTNPPTKYNNLVKHKLYAMI